MAKLPFNNRNAFNAFANNTNRGRRPKFSINYINKVTVKEPKPLELNYPGAVREEEVKPLVLNYFNKTKKDSIQIGGNNRQSFTLPTFPVIPNMIIEDLGNNPFIVAEDRIFIFNITWEYTKQPTAPGSDFTTVPVTAFPLDGVIQGNTRDRPRINIFPDPQLNDYGSDSAFLSAGNGYQIEAGGVAGLMAGAPWGSRASGTETLSTNAKDYGPVGVDIFTVDWFPDPVTTPDISEWTKTSTGNPTEVKYQKLYTEPGNYDITINIYKPDGYNISFAG
jgi:hypothetical protein